MMSIKTDKCNYERKFIPIKDPQILQDGCFMGYASLFDKMDLGNDVIEKGAFKKALKSRGKANVRMLFQHDPDQPIGIWQKLIEDNKGLLAMGKINEGVEKGREVLALIRGGAIDGLSIGFEVKAARYDKKSGIRYISEVDLWEISIVTFPMLPQARINHVKSNHRLARELKKSAVENMRNAALLIKLKIAKNYLTRR